MKKTVLIILALAMVISLAACAKSGGTSTPGGSTSTPGGSTSTPGGSTSTPGGSTTPDKTEEPYEVKFYYTCWWTEPSDEGTKQVEDDINARLAELGYNYTLNIEWISLFEYSTQIDLILASGEKCDIVLCNGFSNMITNGYLTPLDDYLNTELADTVELLGNWLECGKNNGTTYAIPCHKGLVLTYCYDYQTAYVDGVYDVSQINNFYDIEEAFAALKAANPTMYCDIDASRYPDIINNETKTAIVGTYGCTEGDSTTIKNYYTSDAWKSAMDYAYRFRALGYVKPDGSEASSASSTSDWTKEIGIIIAYGSDEKTQGNMYTEKDKDQGGREFAGKAVTVQNLTTTSILWGVSYTSKNVKAAATLLNLMWTDYRILNDLIYGVEGKSYVVVEPTTDYTPEGIGSMDYPEGLNADTVPYNMSLNSGIFGDEFLMLRGSTMSSDTRKYMQDVINNAWVVPTFGFSPSNDEVSVQAASVSNVVSQYYDALRYGDLDPEVYNPQFLQALEEAGINDVLESYQEQINAWLTLK